MHGPVHTSDAGIALIAEFEGFSHTLYNCVAGHCTIGFGHLVHRGAAGSDETTEAPFAAGISREAGLELLRSDVLLAEQSVQQLVRVPLRQPQVDALVSFVFNLGSDAFAKSTLLKRLNDGQMTRAASEFDRWIMAHNKPVDGLVRRRHKERTLFEGKV